MITAALSKRLDSLEARQGFKIPVLTILITFQNPPDKGSIDAAIVGIQCDDNRVMRQPNETRDQLHSRAIRELGSDTETRQLFEILEGQA